MLFILAIIAFLLILFFGSIYTIRALNKIKLETSLKKKINKGSKQDTIEALLKILKKNPLDLQNRMLLTKMYMEEKDYTEAIFHLNNILLHGKNRPEFNETNAQRLLAECYLNIDNVAKAMEIFTQIQNNNPDDPYPLVQLGIIEKNKGELEKASQYFSKAISLDPENVEYRRSLGVVLFESNKYPEALSILQDALEKNTEDPETNYYMGEIRSLHKQFKDAFAHYMKSKNDTRYESQSLLKIGKILRQFGKYDQSRKVLTLVLKNKELKREGTLEALYELGELYLLQKDIQKALAIWEKILSVTSEYRDVKTKLEQYEKTKSNSMLRLYMMASREDFIELCQKIASKFAKNVIIIRTEPQRDSTVEIFAQAVYNNVPTTIYFKFFRGTLNIGQLAIREFYEKLKESKAKQGICITTAEYSEEALSFSEGRIIELLGQKQLLKILSRP